MNNNKTIFFKNVENGETEKKKKGKKMKIKEKKKNNKT